MWRTYHALAVGGNAFGQDCVAQFLETLLWITRRGSFEQQHIQIRHFGELAMKGLDSLTIRNSGWGLRMAVCTDALALDLGIVPRHPKALTPLSSTHTLHRDLCAFLHS